MVQINASYISIGKGLTEPFLIIPYIIDRNKAEKEIKDFFGNAKSVMFGLGLNEALRQKASLLVSSKQTLLDNGFSSEQADEFIKGIANKFGY